MNAKRREEAEEWMANSPDAYPTDVSSGEFSRQSFAPKKKTKGPVYHNITYIASPQVSSRAENHEIGNREMPFYTLITCKHFLEHLISARL